MNTGVSIETRIWARQLGFISWQGQEWDFFPHHHVQTGSGAHPSSCPMGTRALVSGIRQPGHEADHSPPSSAKVNKNAWSCTYTPPIRLNGMVLS